MVPARPDALAALRRHGIVPSTVIDAGAALGDWTRACRGVFPNARYLLAEPVAEFADALRGASDLHGVEVVQAALAAEPGARVLHVHRDLVGSSLLHEREGPEVDGEPRQVRVTTLDGLVADAAAAAPFLVKLDVQGAELDVLRGGTTTLAQAVAVLLEVSFFGFFHGGATFADVVAAMHAHGFAAYDVSGLAYRPLDGALAQADVLFVPESSPARREHAYATRAQRAAQDAAFAATVRRRLGEGR